MSQQETEGCNKDEIMLRLMSFISVHAAGAQRVQRQLLKKTNR